MREMFEQVGVRCQVCSDVIYSNSPDDLEECRCGASSIDGGYERTAVSGNVYGAHGIEWVTRQVPAKNGRRSQPGVFRDEPERRRVLIDGV